MNAKAASILSVIITLCLVGALTYQYAEMKSLRNELNVQAAHINGIETRLNVRQAERIGPPEMRSLEPGIYSLITEVTPSTPDGETAEFSISHFVMEVEVNSIPRQLQFGYARSGLFTHAFYFDYNNDGRVDTKMAREFAKTIPLVGKYASSAIDPKLSQPIYDQLRINVDKAEVLLFEDIEDKADAEATMYWSWLEEQSSDFGKWIEDTIDTEG